MSDVTQREQIETTTSEPLMDGSYQERDYRAFAWRCDGCGLVWSKRHLAVDCESRNHVAAFEAGPYGGTYVLNGVLQGNLRYYPRRALRREPVGQAAPARKTEAPRAYHARMDERRAANAGRYAAAVAAQAPPVPARPTPKAVVYAPGAPMDDAAWEALAG